MNPVRRARLLWILLGLGLLGVASWLVLRALSESVDLYYTPSRLLQLQVQERRVRVGGMVVAGSIRHSADSLKVCFEMTDFTASVPVCYEGILPDLFAAGQGAIVSGRLGADGHFVARQVLAKHDEEYRPPDIEVPPHRQRTP